MVLLLFYLKICLVVLVGAVCMFESEFFVVFINSFIVKKMCERKCSF